MSINILSRREFATILRAVRRAGRPYTYGRLAGFGRSIGFDDGRFLLSDYTTKPSLNIHRAR